MITSVRSIFSCSVFQINSSLDISSCETEKARYVYVSLSNLVLNSNLSLNSLYLDLKILFVRVKLTDLFLIEIIKRSVTFISNKEHMNFRHRFQLKFSFFKQNSLKINFLRVNITIFSPCLMYNLHLPGSL